ncbi:hypothetical protein ACFQX7_21815 [Luedemannella flava]
MTRKASAKDGLRGSRPLAITCANDTLTSDKKFVTNVTFIACAKPHYMEYTGVWAPADRSGPARTRRPRPRARTASGSAPTTSA